MKRASRKLPPGTRKLPGVQPPRGIERDYYSAVRAYVTRARDATKMFLLPALEQIFVRQDDDTAPMHSMVIKTAMARIRFAVMHDASADGTARKAAHEIAGHNDRRSKKLKQVVAVNVEHSDPWLTPMIDNFVELNAALIKSIPEQSIAEVEKIVRIAALGGTRPESLAKDIMARFDVGESRARLLARDQVSKLNGAITQARQTRLGVTTYVWRTSQDERVRDSHKRKESKVVNWDDPPADTGHPGQDYQCRCWADPILPKLGE